MSIEGQSEVLNAAHSVVFQAGIVIITVSRNIETSGSRYSRIVEGYDS